MTSPESASPSRPAKAAGFDAVELFYAGFTFKGWVAYAPAVE